MNVKKILFIAPHSFPIFSSESIVNAKLAYTLAQAGYCIDIYSSKSNNLNYPTSENEEAILNSPNINLKIIEFDFISKKNSIFKNIRLLFSIVIGFFKTGHIYIGSQWGYNVINDLNKKRKRNKLNYDIIITRGFKAEIVGIYYAKKHDIKWIANWNDPYPESKFPSPYGNGSNSKLTYFQEKIMMDIQKYSSANTFPCKRLRDYMMLYLNKLDINKTFIIPHMAHSILIPNMNHNKGSKLKIIHAGNVSSPRDPKVFLLALHRFISDINIRTKIECIFVGKQTDNFIELVNELNINDVITVLPSIDYFSVINLMSKCDISLIIEAICDEGIYLPTKVVDSFQCKLPIFCISPTNGTLNDLVYNNKVGYFASNRSIIEVEKALKNIFQDWELEKLPLIDDVLTREYFEIEILISYKKLFNCI